MTSEEKFAYWLDIAEYDLQAAEAMFTGGRWLYVVFMCQQALEKLVKGLYLLYIDDNIPRLHDINSILDRFKDELPEQPSNDKVELFDTLSRIYLRSRYPDYSTELAKSATHEWAKTIYEKSKEVYRWLLTMKPQSGSSGSISPK